MFDSRTRAKSIGAIIKSGKNEIDIASQITKSSQSNPEMLDSLITKIQGINFFQECFEKNNIKALKVVLREFLKPLRKDEQSDKIQQQKIAKNDQTSKKLALEIKKLEAERDKLVSKNQNLKSRLIVKMEQKLEGGNMQSIPNQGLVSKIEEYSIEHSVLFQKPRLQQQIQLKKAASQPKPLDNIAEQPRKNLFKIPQQKNLPFSATTNKFNPGSPPQLYLIKNELLSKLSSQQPNKMLNSSKVSQFNLGNELHKQQANTQRKMNNSMRLNHRIYK